VGDFHDGNGGSASDGTAHAGIPLLHNSLFVLGLATGDQRTPRNLQVKGAARVLARPSSTSAPSSPLPLPHVLCRVLQDDDKRSRSNSLSLGGTESLIRAHITSLIGGDTARLVYHFVEIDPRIGI
jgi:hypothetical protein